MAEPPTVSTILPLGLQPGKPVDLVVNGKALEGLRTLWSNVPLSMESASGQAGRASLRVTLPSDLPLGIYGLRVSTGNGISNLRLFAVDDLPTILEQSTNHEAARAQAVGVGQAVDGRCEAEQSDFFKLTAQPGQTVSIEVLARRLGSPLDPMIRILDVQGRELAFSDDEPGVAADCRLRYRFAEAGEYLLELRDVRYQGGLEHFYRLRVGEFPLVAAGYPLAVRRGGETPVQLLGVGVESLPALLIKEAASHSASHLNATVTTGSATGSSWLTLLKCDAYDQIEQEPNDTPDQATPCNVEAAISGRLQTPHDRDNFAISGQAGKRYRFVGQSRRVGSPADLFMRLYKPDGTLAVEAEDTAGEEGVIDYTFTADGVYRLMVEDVNRRGSGVHCYRVAVEPYRPGFTLAVENEKYDAPAAGVVTVKVTCVRRDYNGPIELTADGMGEGFTLAGNVIPEGKNETVLSMTVPPSLTPGTAGALQIVGRATAGIDQLTATASTLTSLRKSLAGLPYPPAELDELIGLGIGPAFPDFFELAAESSVVTWPDSSKPLALKLKANRMGGFDETISLEASGLPAEVTTKLAGLEKGQSEATVELTSAAPIPAGQYKLNLAGSAVFQNQPKRRLVEFTLQVGQP